MSMHKELSSNPTSTIGNARRFVLLAIANEIIFVQRASYCYQSVKAVNLSPDSGKSYVMHGKRRSDDISWLQTNDNWDNSHKL